MTLAEILPDNIQALSSVSIPSKKEAATSPKHYVRVINYQRRIKGKELHWSGWLQKKKLDLPEEVTVSFGRFLML